VTAAWTSPPAAIGCRTVLVTTGPKAGGGITVQPDFTAGSLSEAARWIMEQSG
jgi:hypothetical protein